MPKRCSNCGAESQTPGAQFCTACAGPLIEVPSAEAAPGYGPTPGGMVAPETEEAPVPGLPCPHCTSFVEVPWPDRCPVCGERLETRPLDELPSAPLAIRVSDAAALAATILLAGALDAAVFRLITRLAPEGGLLRDMFLPTGLARVVPVAITFLFIWCLLQAAWRGLVLWGQRRYPGKQLRADWLQTLRAGRIPTEPKSLERRGRGAIHRSWWVGRLATAVTQWASTRSSLQVGPALEQHSALDAEAVHSNYSLLRLAIWAMPILGFIGTVVGITLAVQAFSQFLGGEVNDVDSVRTQLMDVTRGLSYAFLTTMHGLVAALLAMFVASVAEKVEGDVLSEADRWALEELAPALAHGAGTRGRGDTWEGASVGDVFERLGQLSEQLSELTRRIGAFGSPGGGTGAGSGSAGGAG
jgi:biopolymer transport protein ExbB/TolQ